MGGTGTSTEPGAARWEGEPRDGFAAHGLEASCTGLGKGSPPEPCLLVIFGASGDLARRELIPSLYELMAKDLLPDRFAVVGFAREAWDDETFREEMRPAVERECRFDPDLWDRFAASLHYVPGDFRSPAEEDYADLRRRIDEIRRERALPDNTFFHLATPAAFFGEIVGRLAQAGLAASEEGWRRLVIEKPFGADRESARTLDGALRRVFSEEQIYRIDHYLGKETVQNMLVFRFANAEFEPIWNRDHIDHIQITVAEDAGIRARAGFYEKTGAVRDMVQNHVLQLLCMATIEPPVRFDGSALRDETAKVLGAIPPPDPRSDCVLGQYGPGEVGGHGVPGYRQEEGVAPDSVTPTYAALELRIDNWRWAGVPIYVRTGKRLARKLTEVTIHFKPTPHLMFPLEGGPLHRNVLAFRLQPEEGIVRTFAAKQPGPELCIRSVRMNFGYAEAFEAEEPPRAYAWLLRDVMHGDPALFARSDWIDRAWRIIDPVAGSHEGGNESGVASGRFPNYEAGSWGPESADDLLARNDHAWAVV